MRVALCLYGYFNNNADELAGTKGQAYIREKIIDYCKNKYVDLDIFIHTWDQKSLGSIVGNYKPVKMIYENQINFEDIGKEHGVEEKKINKDFFRLTTIYRNCTVHASLSFYYSRFKSIQLAIKNSQENGFTYDCVLAARFDLGHRSGMHRGYNVSQIDFNLDYDMSKIYSAMWVQLNAGYADQWFYSNQKNMELLGEMYEDALKDYLHIGNHYWQSLTKGWHDSDVSDEFSNEMLKPLGLRKSTYVYPQWQMINNHLLHKWHFMQKGLYEISKFV